MGFLVGASKDGEEVVLQTVPELCCLDLLEVDLFRCPSPLAGGIAAVLAEIEVDDHKLAARSKRLMESLWFHPFMFR